MEISNVFCGVPQFSNMNTSFDEYLIASGVGKVTWKMSDVCMITTDEFGRSLQLVEIEEEYYDG